MSAHVVLGPPTWQGAAAQVLARLRVRPTGGQTVFCDSDREAERVYLEILRHVDQRPRVEACEHGRAIRFVGGAHVTLVVGRPGSAREVDTLGLLGWSATTHPPFVQPGGVH